LARIIFSACFYVYRFLPVYAYTLFLLLCSFDFDLKETCLVSFSQLLGVTNLIEELFYYIANLEFNFKQVRGRDVVVAAVVVIAIEGILLFSAGTRFFTIV